MQQAGLASTRGLDNADPGRTATAWRSSRLPPLQDQAASMGCAHCRARARLLPTCDDDLRRHQGPSAVLQAIGHGDCILGGAADGAHVWVPACGKE